MKVKALVAFAGLSFSAASGEVVDLPEATAEEMIRAGYAVPVEGEAPKKAAKKATKKKV